ncbi:MAG: hypothetical protein QOE55_582 [Acidobacteriaceae bacterium]|nr:hypothetical protein [Acidobacteriaceae bacterium]
MKQSPAQSARNTPSILDAWCSDPCSPVSHHLEAIPLDPREWLVNVLSTECDSARVADLRRRYVTLLVEYPSIFQIVEISPNVRKRRMRSCKLSAECR